MSAPHAAKREPIAIVGMGCRMPQAEGIEQFWNLLCNGVDAIVEVPASRWDADALWSEDASASGKTYCRWGGFLAEGDCFDAEFFGITDEEAVRMDPQQGLMLEVAWQSLEHAGIAPAALRGSNTGVFVGISNCDYDRKLCSDLRNLDLSAGTGTSYSMVANRLSYVLGLCGPSIAVDLACSSSLVAVHLACQSLVLGECDVALAGGVHLILSPEKTVTFSQGGVLARDGRCKSFASDANGYVRGDGCGMVVLKRLRDVAPGKDRVAAVILGSAVNHNGASNGLSAPYGAAQSRVMSTALSVGGVAPESIGYVEAHSPGTLLGDLIETRALVGALSGNRTAEQRCLIGALKSNIGHLEAAAGIAGLIKIALMVERNWIPRTLHADQLNPNLPLRDVPFEIAQQAQSWPASQSPRRAGVSAFSFGGANAHIVIEAAPREDEEVRDAVAGPWVLPIGARTSQGLYALAAGYRDYCQELQQQRDPKTCFADLCFTAATGRAHFNHRLAVVADSPAEAAAALRGFCENKSDPAVRTGVVRPARAVPGDQPRTADDAANAFIAGLPLNWPVLFDPQCRTRRVPTYVFNRRRHWRDDFAADLAGRSRSVR